MSTVPKFAREHLSEADAIEHRPLPWQARLTLHTLLLAIVAMIAWASLFSLDRIVSARGKLVTTPESIVVQPFETSVIRTIDVRPGQIVKAGERLGTLDPTFADADVGQIVAKRHSLEAQIRRLRGELDGVPVANTSPTDPDERLQWQLATDRANAFNARTKALDQAIAKVKAELDGNKRDQQVLGLRLGATRELEQIRTDLIPTLAGSRVRLLESRSERLASERDMVQASNRGPDLIAQLAEAEANKASFIQEWRQKTSEEVISASREFDAATEQATKARRRSDLVLLTAPTDAVVLEVAKRSVGSVLKEAETLFTLVPVNSLLEVEAQIDARDIGFLRVGDKAHVKVDAFPFQQHGTLDATVSSISRDAFSRDRNGGNAAPRDAGAEAFYIARLAIDAGSELEKLPPDTQMISGMTLTGEIVVGRRKVISYLLYPVFRVFDEGMREP